MSPRAGSIWPPRMTGTNGPGSPARVIQNSASNVGSHTTLPRPPENATSCRTASALSPPTEWFRATPPKNLDAGHLLHREPGPVRGHREVVLEDEPAHAGAFRDARDLEVAHGAGPRVGSRMHVEVDDPGQAGGLCRRWLNQGDADQRRRTRRCPPSHCEILSGSPRREPAPCDRRHTPGAIGDRRHPLADDLAAGFAPPVLPGTVPRPAPLATCAMRRPAVFPPLPLPGWYRPADPPPSTDRIDPTGATARPPRPRPARCRSA